MTTQRIPGIYLDINGKILHIVVAKRASGNVISRAIVDAINSDSDLWCTAHAGKNNVVEVSGLTPHIRPTPLLSEILSEMNVSENIKDCEFINEKKSRRKGQRKNNFPSR